MLNFLRHKTKHIAVTLRFSILSIFVTLFITAILLLISITDIRNTHTLTYIAIQLMNKVSWTAHETITDVLNATTQAEQFSAYLINDEILDPNEMVNYTYDLLKHLRSIQRVMWADESGNFIFSERLLDGTIQSQIIHRDQTSGSRFILSRDQEGHIIKSVRSSNIDYDPRQSAWYQEAKSKRTQTWLGTDINQIDHLLGIDVARPIYNKKGDLAGVFALGVELSFLSDFIAKEQITPAAVTYIVRTDGKVIAFPELVKQQRQPMQKVDLIDVHVLMPPWVVKSFDIYQKTHESNFAFYYGHKKYLASYQVIKSLAFRGWYIGVIIPQIDFIEQLQRTNLINFLIGMSILILGIFLVLILVNRVVTPLKNLVSETEKIKRFDLSGEKVVRSRIKEVMHLSNAIQSMKMGLKAFQKYVPAALVRKLIETGENAGLSGSKKRLAILFSDIKDFTTIAEHMYPAHLMEHICEYFDELSKIIVAEKGTIDKYIGDSIMAFWGAPLSEKNPVHHAAHAALKCFKRLEELNSRWKAEGKPQFITRMGLHVGEAIVGNLGSSERLNYTAIGAAVNTANRLEGINKIYGSSIMVSEAVYKAIKNHFVLRLLDCIRVKGKHKSSFIYELLAVEASHLSFDIHAYRFAFSKGFAAYQRERWDEAINVFNQCLVIYPEDKTALLFIQRCERFKQHPPAKDWDGVWQVSEK